MAYTVLMLSIVATPIGNLKDITLRAVETLREADFIIAENPLHTAKLLKHFEIPKKELVQFADHNEHKVLPKILDRLEQEHGALVSDSGTPGISDPGFRLVRACVEKGVQIQNVPGTSAIITALTGSGLPTDRFLFVGFLPKTEPKLLQALESGLQTESTLVIYESPQRISKTVDTIAKTYPSAQLVVARELTKLHEEFIRGAAVEVSTLLKKRSSMKGEIVLLVSFK
jgi:16S rRNA (cytidine1402-2'-O)-methyltransferase